MTKHCDDYIDDYIDDPAAPDALRRFLLRAREPAHGALNPAPYPTLYATHEGARVRVVMASRFGDVGITRNLTHETGYQLRVAIEQLSDFSETP